MQKVLLALVLCLFGGLTQAGEEKEKSKPKPVPVKVIIRNKEGLYVVKHIPTIQKAKENLEPEKKKVIKKNEEGYFVVCLEEDKKASSKHKVKTIPKSSQKDYRKTYPEDDFTGWKLGRIPDGKGTGISWTCRW